MNGWRLSLRGKITALLFVGMLLPLIAAMSAVALQDIATLRRDLISDGRLLASIVAEYSAAVRGGAARRLPPVRALPGPAKARRGQRQLPLPDGTTVPSDAPIRS